MTLETVDLQCIEFLAQRRGVATEAVKAAYVEAKDRFQFAGGKYRRLCARVHDLLAPLYGNDSEEELIGAYQHHALMHLYRHISYSYWKMPVYRAQAQAILDQATERLTIVDYGCGLGYLSATIARERPETCIYLVDVESLVLEFAAFRFRELGLRFVTIPVTRACIYPELPEHNLCIATEVWEHLRRPMVAYENVIRALEPGGLLAGKMGDHGETLFHVSPDLGALRKRVAKDFEVLPSSAILIRRRR